MNHENIDKNNHEDCVICDNCGRHTQIINDDGFCEECGEEATRCDECREIYSMEDMFRHNGIRYELFLCGYCNQDPTNRSACECNWCEDCMVCAECKREFGEDDMVVEDDFPEKSMCSECWAKREGECENKFVEDLNRVCVKG